MADLHLRASLVGALLTLGAGCGSSLQQPFDQIKGANSNMTAFRLQNYEPPPQQTQQGAPALPIPPGLLQGLIPGAGTPAPQAQPDAPRFHDFRILGYVPVSDPKNRDAVFDLFGHQANFTAPTESCMFAEFGFRLAEPPGPPPAQPADVLVSLSCNQVKAFGFNWPYGNNTALTPDASKKLVEIVKKSFGGG